MTITPFKLARLDAYPLRIPFGDFVVGPRATPRGWRDFEIVLVRLETTEGVVGWGECFAYSCQRAALAAVEDMVFPLLAGREIADIAAVNQELQFRLHIFGRYGITMFAISAVDIALWDIAAQRAGKPLADFLGEVKRRTIPAYASLVRYAEPALTAAIASRAAAENYRHIKLHEIAFEPIAAARQAIGPSIGLMTDVNCSWSLSEAEAMLQRLQPLAMHWVEEPIFPPEDYGTLATLARFGIPLSAGENACTSVEFARLCDSLTYPQPSVIKLGGISEFLKVIALAAARGQAIMPHSPYFGPGYWATLHLSALLGEASLFEFMYCAPDAWLDPAVPLPEGGSIPLPRRPGLGFTPDEQVLRKFALR